MPTSISTTNPNEKIYALTLEKLIPEISWEICSATPLTYLLFEKGCVDEYDANAVKVPVMLEDSPNVRNVGLYGTYSTAPVNSPKAAYFTHLGKKIGSFVADKTELGQCNGDPGRLIDSLKGQVIETFASNLEKDLIGYRNYSDANAFNGLLSALEAAAPVTSSAPTAQAYTVGGIAKATYAAWQNQYDTMTTFAVDGRSTWTKVYQKCSRTGSTPDAMLTDEDVWRLYEETLAGNLQLMPQKMGMTGFLSLTFRDALVVASKEFANITDYSIATPAVISGYTFFLTLTGKPVAEFGLNAEMFAKKAQGAINRRRGKGVELMITKGDMFRLEGPKLMPNADVIQHDLILSGQLVFKSLNRFGITKFTGSVQ